MNSGVNLRRTGVNRRARDLVSKSLIDDTRRALAFTYRSPRKRDWAVAIEVISWATRLLGHKDHCSREVYTPIVTQRQSRFVENTEAGDSKAVSLAFSISSNNTKLSSCAQCGID